MDRWFKIPSRNNESFYCTAVTVPVFAGMKRGEGGRSRKASVWHSTSASSTRSDSSSKYSSVCTSCGITNSIHSKWHNVISINIDPLSSALWLWAQRIFTSSINLPCGNMLIETIYNHWGVFKLFMKSKENDSCPSILHHLPWTSNTVNFERNEHWTNERTNERTNTVNEATHLMFSSFCWFRGSRLQLISRSTLCQCSSTRFLEDRREKERER